MNQVFQQKIQNVDLEINDMLGQLGMLCQYLSNIIMVDKNEEYHIDWFLIHCRIYRASVNARRQIHAAG